MQSARLIFRARASVNHLVKGDKSGGRFSPVRAFTIFVLIACYPSFFAAADEATTSDLCGETLFEEAYVPDGASRIEPPLNDLREPVEVIVPSFCISVDEINVELFSLCVADGQCEPLRGDQNNPDFPVHSVTYDEAVDFVSWLSDLTSNSYRLPSEAEWQVAALAGETDRYPWRVVGRIPEANIFSGVLSEVGITSLNRFGVRDMVGNLSEFVSDCFSEDLSEIPQDGRPFLIDDCGYRLTKGGHYIAPDFLLSPYFRARVPSDFASPQIGFRVARDIVQE